MGQPVRRVLHPAVRSGMGTETVRTQFVEKKRDGRIVMCQTFADPRVSKAVPPHHRLVNADETSRVEVVAAVLVDCVDEIVNKLPAMLLVVCVIITMGRLEGEADVPKNAVEPVSTHAGTAEVGVKDVLGWWIQLPQVPPSHFG